MVSEKEIIDFFLGIPYCHLGRTKNGLDCWGLIKWVYEKMGFQIWDIESYEEKWSYQGKNYFIEHYHKEWNKTDKPDLFDIVLFNNRDGVAYHAGIILSKEKFIHCYKAGTVISRLSDPMWRGYIEGYYHLRKRG